MKRRIAILILIICCLGLAGRVHADDLLTTDLVQTRVDINTGFHGTYVQLFGVLRAPGDVVVVVEGPPRTMSVRRKEKIFGAWVNRAYEIFTNVPSFYAYTSNKPLESMMAPSGLAEQGLGLQNLPVSPKNVRSDHEKIKMFKEALIRNKKKQGLFVAQGEKIKFISPYFFKARIYIPQNVPVGDYTVKTFYFQDGILQAVQNNNLKVAQAGLSADVFRFAHKKRFLYGVLCVTLALMAGWISNRVGLKR